jgi:hypothetical protein
VSAEEVIGFVLIVLTKGVNTLSLLSDYKGLFISEPTSECNSADIPTLIIGAGFIIKLSNVSLS